MVVCYYTIDLYVVLFTLLRMFSTVFLKKWFFCDTTVTSDAFVDATDSTDSISDYIYFYSFYSYYDVTCSSSVVSISVATAL